MIPEPQQNNPTYVIDAENAAEMARLLRQDRLLTGGMGGLFPEPLEQTSLRRILDLGCGPGGWARAVALAFPEAQVTGVDISQLMIEYAGVQAQEQEIHNVTFHVHNVREPLDFADNAFDLINGRFLFAFMSPDTWPKLMQECVRMLRPGGVLILTETEGPLSNSLATERLYGMSVEAMKRAGQSLSPDGRSIGITPMMGKFFRDAGYVNIQYKAHVLDCSRGTPAYQDVYHDCVTGYKLMQSYLVKMGLTMQDEVEGIYQRMLEEQQAQDFCEVWFYLSVWGEKPEQEVPQVEENGKVPHVAAL